MICINTYSLIERVCVDSTVEVTSYILSALIDTTATPFSEDIFISGSEVLKGVELPM